MSRKLILSFAAAATIAVASLSSVSADARGFAGGGGFGGGRSFGGGGRGFGGGATMARLPGGGHGGCCTLKPIIPVGGRPIVPGPFPLPHGHPPGWVFHPHGHGHWVFRFGHWIVVDDVVDEGPATVIAPAVIPGPCTCLTKNYTPSGLVVFADVCTKESASAPVDGSAADASQVPTTPVAASAVPMTVVPTTPNYAGKTYDDYLAANPQAANPQAANPAPQGAQKN
jgi:hypothetical protein